MKQLIRHGVFETNSSSSHSISIANETKEFVLDSLYPDTNGEILLTGGEFGWNWFKHNDALTKANYVAQAFNYTGAQHSEKNMRTLYEVIMKQTGAEDVLFRTEKGYIDHDSHGICPVTHDELKNFIFNKNSWLFGGNDNQISNPTFYITPEYKDGIIVSPNFKYELIILGFGNTTKFIDYPDEKKIDDAISYLLQGIQLKDNTGGEGFIFTKSTNKLSEFVFSSWIFPANIEEKIIYFISDISREVDKLFDAEDSIMHYDNIEGYKRKREIEDNIFSEPDCPFLRKVNFLIKEIC